MKMKLLLIIGLVFLGVLCLCSAVNAFSITSVKVAGQPLSFHMGVAYSTTTIIPRLTFTKNPTITFTVDWTDRGIIGEDGRVTLPGSATPAVIKFRPSVPTMPWSVQSTVNVMVGFFMNVSLEMMGVVE